MSPPRNKKRSSILKKRLSSIETPEKTKRKINFSEKNQIKEFHVCPETATIWGNSYEESLGKLSSSDRSSSHSDASDRKFNSMSMSNFTASSILHESEKENAQVHSEKKTHSVTTFRESLVSLDNCSMVDMSLDTNLAEKKRAKAYEPANSSLMDMSLIDELNQVQSASKQLDREEVKMVLSPRKITFFHESSNLSISIREKVLVKASESLAQQNILINCAGDRDDVTLSLTESEKNLISRKSICQQTNMDLTLENFESRLSDNNRYNLRKKNNLKPKFKNNDLETQKKMLADIEKNHTIHDVSDMTLDTAPIKVPSTPVKKGLSADELMDFMMMDSPTRSVIGINSITKKDEEHFKNSKVIFSASKFAKSLPRINLSSAPKVPKVNFFQDIDLSTDIITVKTEKTSDKAINQRQTINNAQEMELIEDVPVEKPTGSSHQRQTINNVQEMDITEHLVEKVVKPTAPYNHRSTINKAQDMDLNTDVLIEKENKPTAPPKNRQTINKVQDMSMNLSLNPEVISKTHDRRTICETESMNMTNVEPTSTSKFQAFKSSRKSVYTPLDIDETISQVSQKEVSFDIDIPRCETTSSQRRETSYAQNFSFTSNFFDLPAKQQPRSTIYDTNDLDETCSLETTEYLLLKTNKLFANPMMIASTDNTLSKSIALDEENLVADVSMSTTNAFVDVPQEDNFKIPSQRLTINNISMNVSDVSVSMSNLKSKLRPTICAAEDLEVCSPASNQSYSKRSRKTVYEDGMNMSVNQVETPATTKASRKTIHQEETMDITAALVDHKSLIPQLMRKTIYQEEGMNITNTSCKISSPKPKYVPSSRNVRYTVYNEEAMNMSENITEPHSLKEKTEIDSRKTINQEVSIRQLEESTSSAVNNELKPLPSRHSIYIPHEMSVIDSGERPSVIMHGSIIEPVQDDIVVNISGVKSLGAIPKSFANRKTTHLVKDMDTDNTSQHQMVINSPENKKSMIFEVYQDSVKKSAKLLNITDAEIPLYDCDSPAFKEDTDDMLDNESFPLIEESADEFHVDNEESDDMQLSIVTPNYLSENFKDFINITLASPQGSSARTSSSNISIMSIQGTASTSIDDKFQKMDDFLEQLEKGVEKPRVKIDEFLAKLNIPIREPPRHLPIFDEDYFERKFREVQEQFEEATRLEKEMAVPQFPEIPTFTFLWKNHMECDEEQIRREVQEELNQCCVTPIFPESKDFIFLLANKFKTDRSYCNWDLDTTFAPWRLFKISHKRLKAFVINIVIHEDVNVNESTIPIYFEKCFMIRDQWHKGILPLKTQFIIREFEKNLGTDNFISLCKTSKELFSFMDYYEEVVMRSKSLVNNLYNIVVNCDAIIEVEQERVFLFKRHFVRGENEIVDLRINLHKHIEDISVEDLHIKSLTKYFYEGKQKMNGGIQHIKGLMLIEIVLFDTEKFLRDHTIRCIKPEFSD